MSQSPEILKAEQCDKSGDFEGALKHLLTAAQKGEHSALTTLGIRHLLGQQAPVSPALGIKYLQQAAERQQVEAMLLLSVLHALGYHVPQEWNRVIGYLVMAATLGEELAQDQLAILCKKKKLLNQRSNSQDYWLELARNADLDYWHTPGTVETLCDNPRVGLIRGLAPKEVCLWLIKRSEGKLIPAEVYDSVAQKTIQHNTRTNSAASFGFTETSVVACLLQIKIAKTMKVAFRQLEPITVLHYKGNEEIKNHFDFIDPGSPHYEQQIAQRGDRIITFLTYLNDNYTGGETDFPKVGLKHKGTRGDGLFFINVNEAGKPNMEALHAGRPPTSGEKWISTQFIRNKDTF